MKNNRKLHLALGVVDVAASVKEYSKEFGVDPVIVIEDEYALWRTDTLNVSIRRSRHDECGKLRHLGWESDEAAEFSVKTDCNGIAWEDFNASQQAEEINQIWPGVEYSAS